MQKNQRGWQPQINKENKPLYKEIVRLLRQDISLGKLQAGDKMPPQRELAWAIGVNPSTIKKAYELATQQNLISGEIGRGTYFRGNSAEAWLFRLNHQKNHGDLTTISPQLTHGVGLDLLTPLLNANAWGYIEINEIKAMQQAIRAWDKLPFTNDALVLTAGAHHALATIADFLCGANDNILCEEYTYPGLLSVQHIRPYRLQPVAMDEYGIIPQALEAAIKRHRPKLLTLMSHSQNPTMTNMPLNSQQEISDIIDKYQLTTVEDDVWGRFSDAPCLYETNPQHVIRLNSFSKTISGGMRIGWIRGYQPILQEMQQSPELSSWMIAPPLMRLMLHWLNTGYAEQLFEEQRAQMQRRSQLSYKILGIKLSQATSYLWLKTAHSGSYTAQKLAEQNIKVAPAQAFSPIGTDAPYIRLSLLHQQSDDELRYMLQKVKPYLP